jgi:hypothetical protein
VKSADVGYWCERDETVVNRSRGGANMTSPVGESTGQGASCCGIVSKHSR